eukprot:scaffold11904_cov17-Tisochrysis_lutea.AAC.2
MVPYVNLSSLDDCGLFIQQTRRHKFIKNFSREQAWSILCPGNKLALGVEYQQGEQANSTWTGREGSLC